MRARVVLSHGSLGGLLKAMLVLTSKLKIFFMSLSLFLVSKNNLISDACTTLVLSLGVFLTFLALVTPTVSWFGFWLSNNGCLVSQSGGSLPFGLWWLWVWCWLVGFCVGFPEMVLVSSKAKATGLVGFGLRWGVFQLVSYMGGILGW